MTRLAALAIALAACAPLRTVYICERTGAQVSDIAACTAPDRATAWRAAAAEALRAGDVVYDAGQFDRALRFYLEAWGLQAYALRSPEWDTLYRAAQAARLGGHGAVAGWLYRVYLVRTARDGATTYRSNAVRWVDKLNDEVREPSACEVRTLQEVRGMVEEWRGR